ncbi:MAG: dihydrolipoamide acetyltransferase family protein [Bacillota bacterium]|nr:dihydrolipoamide acetyltransferase family protein [Bacillota bacterium]
MEKIILPKQGLQMVEGIITKWLVEEGEQVREGEPLFEMETDKLTITIDSTATGTMLKILHPAGDVVPVAETIALVGEPGEEISIPSPEPEDQASTSSESPAREKITPRAKWKADELGVETKTLSGSGPDGLIIEKDVVEASKKTATPLARRLADLHAIDIEQVPGTGARAKVVAEDVLSYSGKKSPPDDRETRVPHSSMRRIIARRMKESLDTMAQANHQLQVDMTDTLKLREQIRKAGTKVSINDIVLRCVAHALLEFPMLNAVFTDNEIIQKHYVNLGVAVATQNGLLVPVIRNADQMNLPQLAAAVRRAVERAKENALSVDDISGGTFTVTNLGMLGMDCFTAIINATEAAILAVGAVKKQAVVMEDGSIQARDIMWLSLTYDHRIVDGAPAAEFLVRVKQLLENPGLLI